MPDEKGVLLFAYDNESISYTNLAIICALLVRKHLPGTGIALVTNNPVDGPFDHIIHVDAGNSGRRTFRNPGGDRKNTSELQSHSDLVCRLLLEKKKQKQQQNNKKKK